MVCSDRSPKWQDYDPLCIPIVVHNSFYRQTTLWDCKQRMQHRTMIPRHSLANDSQVANEAASEMIPIPSSLWSMEFP
jgi:hypothetical protein